MLDEETLLLFKPVFTPIDISGLQIWLVSDRGLYQTTDTSTPAITTGNPIGRWEDQSGNGRHFTNGTSGSQPVLQLSLLNGKPGIRFDGVDDDLRIASPNIVAGPYTLASVYDYQGGLGTAARYLLGTSNNFIVFTPGTGSGASNKIGYFDSQWRDMGTRQTGIQIVTWVLGNGTGEIFRNGTSLGTAPYIDRAMSSTVGLGSNGVNYNGPFKSDIFEICLFDKVLTPSQRIKIERYFLKRYAISYPQ